MAGQGYWREDTPEERERQRAARNAVMNVGLFPDLPVALRHTLGYGPHVDVLQHLVYWFSRPKMQSRWTLWKTFAEWWEKCGLSKRQVRKGREKLAEQGIVEWNRGQYGRIHYRIDWVVLAQTLNLVFNQTAYGVLIQSDRFSGQFNQTAYGGLPNTEEYGSRVLSENSLLHTGNGPLSAAPIADEREKISKEEVANIYKRAFPTAEESL